MDNQEVIDQNVDIVNNEEDNNNEDNSEIDVEALLARIDGNFENEIEDVLPQNQSDEHHTQHQNSDQIMIIRDQPIQKDIEECDPIIEILNRVEIQNSLLTNSEINQHQLETEPLQQIVQSIKDRFDKHQEQITKKQRQIFGLMIDARNESSQLVNLFHNNTGLTKIKLNDFKNKQKEIENLEIASFKTKGYVLSIIERLELIEQQLDKKIDVYVKQRLKELEKH